MKINDMFVKKISRPIQGVVKVGQDTDAIIKTELDEYVVTKELHEHFKTFFNAYRKGSQQSTDKMGVWISGFFGSGKSHFLKILSYLLGEQLYGGKKAINYFEGKIADGFVMADMQVAADTNADIILFNIDAEADANPKTGKDPIVKVFMKMFNKMQGFCASLPWVADLERQMVERGVYEKFKDNFKKIANADWEDVREDFYFEQDNIIQALDESGAMSREAAVAWCNRSVGEYSLDISTFARRVREYIEAKEKQTGKKMFVVFLCDEVGQYIGSSGPLMLNLQNIVEGLGTECGGRAWVICTGQEDIDLISKNLDRDAFSKIIGRFDTRLKLSSANVDEVIKKRLLDKTDGAREMLQLLYEEKHSVIKNLITFAQGKQEMRIYESADDFINVYPFIPYQFKLLQDVFNGIRTHGASGKHLSEGERSLLNAYQEAAMQFEDAEAGALIPFNAFYKTVETFLDHNIRKVISDAKDMADRGTLQGYDVEVLKTLFMIKYIADKFSPNLENITTIMLSNIDQDKLEAKREITDSLRRLEEQKFIIRNGDQFIFLTNEEQDINREITDIRIDPSTLVDEAGKLIFSVLFGLDRKFRYSSSHDFPFNTYVDDKALGNQKEEIGIRVITPYYTGNVDVAAIGLRSAKESNVIVVLPSNADFMEELKQSMQIDEFIRRGQSRTFSDTAETIVSTKRRESTQRKERCKDLITDALKVADIYVNGNKLNIKEKAPRERINDAFGDLIEIIYSKLSYIKEPILTVTALSDIFNRKFVQGTLDGVDIKEPNHLALDEVYEVIARSSRLNVSNTMRALKEQFGKAPYAWKELDVAGILLTLFKEQKIRLEISGENITVHDSNIISYATKREYADRLVVKVRDSVAPHLIANAKDLVRDVFGRSELSNDEDGIVKNIKGHIDYELTESKGSIEDLLAKYDDRTQIIPYPGKSILEDGKKVLESLKQIKDTKEFFEELQTYKDDLLDYSQDVVDVKKFFKGSQKDIFDKAVGVVDIFNKSRDYSLGDKANTIVDEIERILKLDTPYAEIQKLPSLREQFNKVYIQILEKECEPIIEIVKADMAYTLADLEHRPFKEEFESKVRKRFEEFLSQLGKLNRIPDAILIKESSDRAKTSFIQLFSDEAIKIAKMQAVKETAATYEVPEVTPKPTKTVSIKTLISGTSQIEKKEDIDRLLDELRAKLEKEFSEDTTLRIV